jgi:hypothetical protein
MNRTGSGGAILGMYQDGTIKGEIGVESTGITFNESGADLDFRVESNGNTHMLFVDGGSNQVHVATPGVGPSNFNVLNHMSITSGAGTQYLLMGNQDSGGANNPSLIISVNGTLLFGNGDSWSNTIGGTFTERFRIADTEVVVNESSLNQDFRVESDNNTNTFTVDASADACLFGKSNDALTTTGATISAAGTATFAFSLTSENESFILNNNNATGATYKMDFRQNNSSKGNIAVGSSSTAYNTSSDYRLKENIETLKDGLSRLAQLKPVQFTWTTDGAFSEGFIAHEVDGVFPDAVTGEKDAVDEEGNIAAQQMDYGRITPLLVKAIQEQQEQIEELKAEIAKLKGE